jgi:hypothetical protein
MKQQRPEAAKAEKGSALIISVLVTAIMSLLGISYLLMADTENKIAENEKLSSQCLYFGEGTIREVKRWFDRPPYGTLGTKNLVKPTTAVMVRTLREIDVDGDGPTPSVTADGSLANPYYKVGIDRDGDTNDDIFDKPFRPALADMLVGIEGTGCTTCPGPDIRIDRGTNLATAAFLDGLGDQVAPNFPAQAAGIRARVKTIDIYAPPYLNIVGTWTRYGMATVKVTVEIVKTQGATSSIVATRIVKAVLNETPYPGPFGPLQSCDDMQFNGDFAPHWGTSTAVGSPHIGAGANNKIPLSLPRDLPPSSKIDLLHGWNDSVMWNGMYKAGGSLVGKTIDDPWYRIILDGTMLKAGPNTPMWTPAVTPQQPYAPITTDQDESNKFQNFGGVGCPEFDYETWKAIARSGGPDVHYYTWNNGAAFQENGVGPATAFTTLTDNKQGLFFFETKDKLAPHDFDATNLAVNLTPEMKITANYGVQGFMYTNTVNWTSQGSPGRNVTGFHWPAEPFRDNNPQNGRYDPGEDFVNLNYMTGISTTDPHDKPVVRSAVAGVGTDLYGSTDGINPVWNARGPVITGQQAIVWGLLYLSGEFDAQGTPMYFGSVVTKAGMVNSLNGTPDLFWDTDLKDNWPPPGWELPRVIITRWETDL